MSGAKDITPGAPAPLDTAIVSAVRQINEEIKQRSTDLDTSELSDSVSQSYYIKREISPGISQHRFFRGSNWSRSFPNNTPQHAVFLKMRDHGVYSLVEV